MIYERWCTDTGGYDNTAPDWTMGGVWGDQPSWYRWHSKIFAEKRWHITSSTNHNIYREEVFEAIWVILVLEAQKWMRFFEVGQLLARNVSMQ